MGNEFKINGDVVERQEWEALRQDLPTGLTTWLALWDDTLTKTELNDIFDRGRDGPISSNTFQNWSSNRFDNVAQILSRHGFPLVVQLEDFGAHVPETLWSSKEFILAVVKQYGGELRFADSKLQADRDVVLTAVKEHGGALEFADPKLKADKEIVLAAVKTSGWALRFADPKLKADRDFVLTVIKQNGWTLQFVDPKLKADKEIILAAVKENGRALEFADLKLKADRDIILTAVKENGEALEFADPSLQKDPSFLTQLALINIGVLEYINPPLRDAVWQNIVKVKEWGDLLPQESLFTYNSWKQALKDHYNIEFIQRFRSFEVLYSTVTLRHNLQPSPLQPLAIINYPKADYNGAFTKYPLIDRLIELGYQVFYYEDAKEAEVKRDLAQATQDGEKKADLIVWSGHGNATTLKLSDEDLGESKGKMRDETRYIDTGDFDKSTPDIPLAQFIKPTGDLILSGCSNGEGKEANPNNLANTIARILPKGVTLHASDKPMNISDISCDPSGKLNVTWTQDSLYTPKGKE